VSGDSAESTRKSEKDIFDDSDFEVDALDSDKDSDDRPVQLETQRDFEPEDADTGSVDQNALTAEDASVDSVVEKKEEDTFSAGENGMDRARFYGHG